MDYYQGIFTEMCDARKVYSRLKAKYNGVHTDIKLRKSEKKVLVPEFAKGTLEELAERLNASCKISKVKK